MKTDAMRMGDLQVVRVAGEFVGQDTEGFMIRAGGCDNGLSHYVLDVSALEEIDSSGVGAIVSLLKRSKKRDGDVVLVGLHGHPREVFELLRLDRVFRTFENLDAALRACRKNALPVRLPASETIYA